MIKFAMIFPGHGFQNFKIIKKLHKKYTIIQKTFSKASEYLNCNLWKKFLKNTYQKNKYQYFSQIEILIISISLYKLWKKKIGIYPYIMTGHSLGQYSALVCSNVLTFSDALKIVYYRQKLMKKKIGIMYAVIGLKEKIITEICQNFGNKNFFIACINSHDQIIITGKKKYSKKIIFQCKKNGAKHVIKLPIKNISHCPLMKEIKEKMFSKFSKINFHQPKNFIMDSTLVKILYKPQDIKHALFNQICKPVYWEHTINFLISKKIKYFLEMNTGNFLTKLSNNKKKYHALYIKKIFY
ncbi:acyltransferase domain-containing protein [Buchnera aphidicola]|uniref:acyltransferase domain-containing protein n=1 Tax=Buchnera aphidicola TaxID=9 RepID=UPI0020935C87|nr:acyltransferase domain-containing protein [Buchnera aphidicola]USS94354.1 acyltransferase domain-containing protein [Buchnera aphidicola (Sipha maydis)]WII23513.1 acyltransferase domain-containing protein [Buchnera aphidicola (Sipha maydis)]